MNKQLFIKQQYYRFRRFLNKGYAAFISMHRQVMMGCIPPKLSNLEMLKAGKALGVICIMLIPTLSASADETPDDGLDITSLQLQEVQVVQDRSEFRSDIFRLVTNITHEQIADLPVSTVSDLLHYLPGVDLRERGASGVQADLSMRGGTHDQVLILVNGVNMTDCQVGHYSMDLPIDVSMIERIEVMQGTSYGLGAFSGAINIITRKGTEDNRLYEIDIDLAAGEYGLVNPSVSAHLSKNEWYLNTSASYNRSSGYASNTDYYIANAYLRTGWKSLDFQLGAQYKDAGANSFYSLAYPNQFDATRTLFSTLSYEHHWGDWSIDGNAYYRAHYDRFELFRDAKTEDGNPAPDWYVDANRHWTHTTGLRLFANWSQWWGKTTVGLEMRDEYINSNNLGVHNRFNINYMAEQKVFINNFYAGVGAGGIWNSGFGNDYSLGANLGYEFNKEWRVFANFNRAIRIPTYTDLYYQSATQLSNPNLGPEKALQLEGGVKYEGEHWFASASGYYRWGQDIIDWIKEPDESIVQWHAVNYTNVNAGGLEANVGVQGYEYIRRIELSYSFCDMNKNSDEMLSKYALDYMRHKLSLSIDHRIWKGLGAAWVLRFQQRDGNYSDREGNIQSYSPVLLLDGKVYWQGEGDKYIVRVSVECKNMTNRKYYDYGGILQPQHWLQAKVGFTLK